MVGTTAVPLSPKSPHMNFSETLDSLADQDGKGSLSITRPEVAQASPYAALTPNTAASRQHMWPYYVPPLDDATTAPGSNRRAATAQFPAGRTH